VERSGAPEWKLRKFGSSRVCCPTILLFWNIIHAIEDVETPLRCLKTSTFGLLLTHP
jgi:hypothetical protein